MRGLSVKNSKKQRPHPQAMSAAMPRERLSCHVSREVGLQTSAAPAEFPGSLAARLEGGIRETHPRHRLLFIFGLQAAHSILWHSKGL